VTPRQHRCTSNDTARKILEFRERSQAQNTARKLIYLAITRAQTKWRHTYNWNAAMAAFKIHFAYSRRISS
jgi:transposase-like protein